MKAFVYTSTPVHQYTSKKFCKFFTVLILTFMLIGSAKAQNCKPILKGNHSMCSALVNGTPTNYEIVNYNSAFTYQATVIFYPSGTSSTFNVTNNIFPAYTIPLSNSPNNILVILNSLDPISNCTGSDTIFVQSCCDEFNVTNITDLTTIQIPNTITNGTVIYDPLQVSGAPVKVAIHGELTVNQPLVFANTQIVMDQGASIRVTQGGSLGLINTTITHGRCNYMWEGITLENNATLKTANGVTISDAHYAINVIDNAKFNFSEVGAQTTNFTRNYISFYAGKNTNGHTIELKGSTNPGININGSATLLTPYWGQPAVPLSNSFAGIYLNDVPNFTNKYQSGITFLNINNINLGIVSINGSIDLPSNVTISNIASTLIGNQELFLTTKRINGTAIYCEGSNNTPQTITFGNLNNTGSKINTINFCKYGVFAFKNVNVICINNNIDNVSNLGGVRVNNDLSIGNSTIIKNNRFGTRFYCAIFCMRFNSAHLEIDNNTFNTGPYYLVNSLPGPNLTNVGIRLAFASPTTLTGYISNNQFTSARIGIFATNIRGESSDINRMFSIDNNTLYFDKPYNDYRDQLNFIQYHTAIWLQQSNNIHVYSNNTIRNAGLNGAPLGFENFLTGIKIDDCNGEATLIENNTLTRMGTGILINKNCTGSNFYCNAINGDISAGTQTFPRGIHFQNTTLGDQGNNSNPYNNTFSNFAGITRKLSGIMASPMKWFYSTNFAITPYSVNPMGNFSPQIANVPISSSCGVSNPSLTDAVYERVKQIIYNEIQYDEDVEENTYFDKVFAYIAIKNDSLLESLDQNYTKFIDEHSQDNIGQYVDAISLRNESEVIQALDILNSLTSTNLIESNKLTVDRIALTIEMEDRELSDSEIEILNGIAESNADIGGEGVVNSRTLLNREIYEEPSYLRVHNSANTIYEEKNISMVNIHQLSLQEKEKINVEVLNVLGQVVYIGTFKSWENYRKSYLSEVTIVKYYNVSEYLGFEKTFKLN